MHDEHDTLAMRDVNIGEYMSRLSLCQDGYSLSKTPVPGFDSSEVLARINECHPLMSKDGSFKSEILRTVFNIGLKKTDEKPLWIVPNSIRNRRYGQPPKKGGKTRRTRELKPTEYAIHRQFANLTGKDEKDILNFANSYGLLKRHPVHKLVFKKRNTGQQLHLGESLLWWKEEILDLAACLKLWDMVLSDDEELKDTILWHRDGITIKLGDSHIQLIGRANMNLLGKWSKGDAKRPALYYLSLETDKRLFNALTPRASPFQNFEVYFLPETLLATIWLMFLWEFSGRISLLRCASCGEYFAVQDPRTRFCSTRCRMRNYRKRYTHKSKGRARKSAKTN